MPKQDHRPRDEARELILQAITEANSGLTRTQIANAIERTKTPHLIDLIEELVDEGHLTRHVKVFGNGVEGYIYSLTNR
jgi:rRNA maturation protein Rpf1